MNKLKFIFTVILILLALNFSNAALVRITSNISADTNWTTGNTYYLENANLVVVNGTLRIEPGVVVKYPAGGYFSTSTNGIIIAEGTAENRIIFTSCKDTTVGENTSSLPLCTGSLGDRYYNRAISLLPESPRYIGLNYKFLEFRYAATAFWAYQDINSITDCNFSFGDFLGGTGIGFVGGTGNASNHHSTKFERNTFTATNYGYNLISITYDFNGYFKSNSFTLTNLTANTTAYLINSGSANARNIEFSDNNFNLTNSKIYLSGGTMTAQDLNFFRNQITANNTTVANNIIQTYAPTTGIFQDNNILITGNYAGFFYYTSGDGNANVSFIRNRMENTGYNMLVALYNSRDYYGDINGNTIIAKDNYGFALGYNSTYTCHTNVFDNNITVVGGYRTAGTNYAGISFICGADVRAGRNTFNVGYANIGLRLGSTAVTNQFTLTDNNFIVNDNSPSATTTTTGLFTNTAPTIATITNNNFDINGKNNASYYSRAMMISGDFNGVVEDNNFALKNLSIGINATPLTTFAGSISDNNFWIQKGQGIYLSTNGLNFNFDFNRNHFGRIILAGESHTSATVNSIVHIAGTSIFSGNISNNIVEDMVSPAYYFGGEFSGNMSDNILRNTPVYYASLYYFNGAMTGKFTRNTNTNVVYYQTVSTNYFFAIWGNFNGEISQNLFQDINIGTGSGAYAFRLSGVDNIGKILDNNFVRVYQQYAGTQYTFFFASSGTFNIELARNNFEGYPSQVYLNTVIYMSTNFSGSIHSNRIYNYRGSTGSNPAYFLRPTITLSGQVYDNNFYSNTNMSFIYSSYGTYTGEIYNNNFFDNNTSSSSVSLIYFGIPFSGKIYGNKFERLTNNAVLQIAGISTGEIYNNLFNDINYAGAAIYISATTSTSIVNNTFNKMNNASASAIYYGASTTSLIANNLFTNLLRAHSIPANFTGTARNNAYYNVTTIGASSTMTVNDLNSSTGFTANPFISDNSDRNFLLNTDQNGGRILIDAGYGTISSYYANRTTQTNNSLDRNIIDIGYHYDQNAPYTYIISPNGGENISGTQQIDFNIESSSSDSLINTSLYYSDSNLGGTLINESTLNQLTCTQGPVYFCTYSWDSSDLRDGNYYLILNTRIGTAQYTDSSNSSFYVLSVPKVSLKTYLGNKPRGYYANGQDVNLIVITNSAIPLITIISSDENVVVDSELMSDITGANDLNIYQYTYTIDSNNPLGWFDVKISGKTFEDVFYKTNEWSNKFTDLNGNIMPFSMDLNLTEPGTNNRWFSYIEIPAEFTYGADENAIRVIEYSQSDSKYLEIPSQIYDKIYSGEELSSAKISALISLEKNEERQFFITYSKSGEKNYYQPDSIFTENDSNYSYENSLYKSLFSINNGGLFSDAFSKLGSKNWIGGYYPILLSPEIKTGVNTYSAVQADDTTHSIDLNDILYTRLILSGNSGEMDYNIIYHLYAKQSFFKMDLNVKPKSSKIWSYLYDDYIALKSELFNKYVYKLNSSITESDINTTGSSDTITTGNIDYWGAYKRSTGEGYGSVFLSKTGPAYTPENKFYDDSDYEYLTRKIYSGSVTSSNIFSTTTARVLFNSWNNYSDLNDLYNNFQNPITFTLGEEINGDNNSPAIIEYTYQSTDLNDSMDLNISINATDNIEVIYIDINAIGHNFSYAQRQEFSDSNVLAYFTIPSSVTNAGHLDINLIVTDIAANQTIQSIELDLNDSTKPEIISFNASIDSNKDVDPNKNVLFDLNLIEYSQIISAKIFVRDLNSFDSNSEWSDWSEYDLNMVEQSDYNYHYDYNYNLGSEELTFEFKAQITDSNGFVSDSNTITLYSKYDYTWEASISQFEIVSALMDTNATIEDFNIINTGDKNLSFLISTDWDYPEKVFINNTIGTSNYSFTLEPNEIKTITPIITAKSNERTDLINITINALEQRATPDNNQITGSIISYANGPFMLLEMTDYPTSATQGDSNKTFTLKVTNKGNETADQIDLNWTIPENWSITFGSAQSKIYNLEVGESSTNAITVTVGNSATIGAQTITVTATPNEDGNKLKTKSVSMTVNLKPTEGDSGNGGDTGGSPPSKGSSSGGSSSPFVNTQQKDLFFQTNEFFELVRGQDNSFEIKFTNPLTYKLVKIRLDVNGILSSYLILKDKYIDSLDSNKEFNTSIEITSPKYFNPGEYELTFTIDGYYLNNSGNEIGFKEERNIKLLIHDTNKQTAEYYLTQIQFFINELSANNYKLNELPNIQKDANILFKKMDYDGVKTKYDLAQNIFLEAINASEQSKNISGLIGLANTKGIETPNTNRLLALAQLAFQRGDYSLALSRLKEAELTYSLETKGELNLVIWTLANLDRIVLIIILALLAIYLFSLGYGMIKVDRQINQLNSENTLLLSLIADIQKKSFIENKISLGEYYDALSQFEGRIAEVAEKFIQLTTKKNNMLTFSTQSTKLKKERKSLIELVKEAQKQYFNLGLIETRIYQTKIHSLTKRITEVDEQITTNDLTKTLRTNQKGPTKYLWKIYYTILK